MIIVYILVGFAIGCVFCGFIMQPYRQWSDGYDAAMKNLDNWRKGYDAGCEFVLATKDAVARDRIEEEKRKHESK